jgi:hypothetical protein
LQKSYDVVSYEIQKSAKIPEERVTSTPLSKWIRNPTCPGSGVIVESNAGEVGISWAKPAEIDTRGEPSDP